jgi:hypothetical protein
MARRLVSALIPTTFGDCVGKHQGQTQMQLAGRHRGLGYAQHHPVSGLCGIVGTCTGETSSDTDNKSLCSPAWQKTRS